MMWLGSNERGQKRMVDVDNSLPIIIDEIRRKDLHVASQHNQIDIESFQQRVLAFLGRGLISLGHLNQMEWNAVKISVALGIGMIADNQGNIASQLASVPPIQ